MNLNKVKNMIGVIMPQLMTTVLFFGAFILYGMMVGIVVLLCSLMVTTLLARILLKNPFTQLIEGEGILALDITSTGIIKPFIVRLQAGKPYLKGFINGNSVKGIFNRQAVTQLHAPVDVGNHYKITEDKDGKTKIYINMDEDQYNSSRFQLNSFPTLIYNSQIDSILTKDFLSEQEKSVFAEHTLLFLNQKLDELTTLVRDFGRGVVESLKPKFNPLGSWITWVIVIIIMVVLGVLFGPAIFDTLSTTSGVASGAALNTASTITPVV